MEVRKAKSAGFCFGVKKAMETVYQQIEQNHGKSIYTFGPLIHNEEVVKELKGKGVEVSIVFTGKEYDYRNPDYTIKLKEEIKEAGLENNFCFLGFTDNPFSVLLIF